MGLNLHQIVSPAISVVNPPLCVSIQVSTGNAVGADGTPVATYAPAVMVDAQVQPMTWRDIQMTESLNLQGTRMAIYIYGKIDGLVRATNQGGDIVTFPNGSVWLVAQVLEGWSLTAGFTKAAITLQDNS